MEVVAFFEKIKNHDRTMTGCSDRKWWVKNIIRFCIPVTYYNFSRRDMKAHKDNVTAVSLLLRTLLT